MKRIALFVALLLSILSACGCRQPSASTNPARAGEPKQVRVLCTTFPIWLFARNVAQGAAGVQVDLMLSPSLGCPHDYVLTPQDMHKLAAADVLLVNGLGLEEFLGEPIRRANDRIKVIDASQGIGELLRLGREEKHGDHRHTGLNPHLFASPKMAARIVRNIAAGLSRIDPDHAKLYAANAEAYAGKLEKLAGDFAAAAKGLKSTKIVAEHAVLDYLARDCGLEIVAVVEETPGQEPSASRMLEIVRTIRESGAAAVFTEPQYPAKVAQTIAKEASVPAAALDPVAGGPQDAAADYYEKTMRQNLETLVQVLGGKGK